MSYEDGWAAINLEMPARVPRTEYSVGMHDALLSAVSGLSITSDSPDEDRRSACATLYEKWNFCFFWSILIHGEEFGDRRTKMGHAEYAANGADRDDEIRQLVQTPEEVLGFDFDESFGRPDMAGLTKRFEEHYRKNVDGSPTGVHMTGIYISLVSGLIDLFGWDMLLLAAGTDSQGFGALANRYSRWIQHYFDALAAADVPVVMIHDDIVWESGAFLHPDWYRQYVFPNLKRQIRPLVESGKKIMFTSDGNYTEFIDDIADLGVNGFVLEPSTDMAYIAEKYGKTHSFIGNADTRILLNGTKEDIRNEVQRCMDIGKKCPGYFLAVGNHIPANTPLDNVLYYNDVYQELSRR